MISSFGFASKYAEKLTNSRNRLPFLNVKLACRHSE